MLTFSLSIFSWSSHNRQTQFINTKEIRANFALCCVLLPYDVAPLPCSGLLHWHWDNFVVATQGLDSLRWIPIINLRRSSGLYWASYSRKAVSSYWIQTLENMGNPIAIILHDDVIKWKYFPRYWPVVSGIHRPPHENQWRGALMFSLICAWINGWVNNREAGDLRRYRIHYSVIVML